MKTKIKLGVSVQMNGSLVGAVFANSLSAGTHEAGDITGDSALGPEMHLSDIEVDLDIPDLDSALKEHKQALKAIRKKDLLAELAEMEES